MKKILSFLFGTLCFMFFVMPVFAQYGQYGGPSPSQSILITKMTAKSVVDKGGQIICDSSLSFRDNFSPTDPRFAPNDFVCFQLKVQNTSNISINNVTVKDSVPSFINPVNGPGTFDSNSRTLTFDAGNFNAGESKTYFLLMQVQLQNQLPADKGLFCLVNKAQAFNSNTSDDSSSQFCIEKQVQGVTTTPSAGPEMGVLLITGEVLTLSAGLLLKRFSNLKK